MHRMKGHGHELPADDVKSIDGYKKHLCNLASDGKRVFPYECVQCESRCKYGQNMLRDLTGMGLAPALAAKSRSELNELLHPVRDYGFGMKTVLRWHYRGK